MHRARVAGHICLDLMPALTSAIPGPGSLVEAGQLTLRLGGCVANTGGALAALGADVELVATVGDDILGDAVASLLDPLAVTKVTLRKIRGQSTSYSVVLEPPGEDRRFLHHVGTNSVFDSAEVPVDDADLLHVGYPQLLPRLLADGGAGLADLMTRARDAGATTSVDFATADPAQAAARPWSSIMRRWAPLIDVLTPSVDDLRPVFPDATHGPAAAVHLADELVRAGVGLAVVTAGPAGLCLRTGDVHRLNSGGPLLGVLGKAWANRQLWATAAHVRPVRTTGAGDVATAGFLFGLLSESSSEEAVRLAIAAAALHISGVDPLPPWSAQSPYRVVSATRGEDLPPDIRGWTAGKPGLLYGPADGKEVI